MITTSLCVLSFYFLKNEWRSLESNRLSYFKDFWNYIDIIPPIMILAIVGLDYYPENTVEKSGAHTHTHTHEEIITTQYALQAVANFAMWFKIFYFLRIFRQTGYFVNMLLRVVTEAKIFALLYLLITVTFWLSFYIMSDRDVGIIWVYMIGMGEYDMEFSAYQTPNIMMGFFILVTIVVNIVMLNLLIAIISSSYEKVIETQQEANDYERVALIADNSDLVPKFEKEKLCKPNEFLTVAQRIKNLDNIKGKKQD